MVKANELPYAGILMLVEFFFLFVQWKSRRYHRQLQELVEKCIYNYFLKKHVIALFNYHTLEKRTKYEFHNSIARMLKKLSISKGAYWIRQ